MREWQMVQLLLDSYRRRDLSMVSAWQLVGEAREKWTLLAPYPLAEAGDLQQREWVLAYASAILELPSSAGSQPTLR